ncbi:MAG TPA: Gfo/Idh/MocA family oxidoreductase [Sedimentisphaerales bacterium]|nr:Gfo/Idh/MocA family oxidoreductase [Sedimentisphaerales bacterium]
MTPTANTETTNSNLMGGSLKPVGLGDGPVPADSKSAHTKPVTRRSFLQRVAAASSIVAVPWIVPSSALGAAGNTAPSNRITAGLIGNGIMGRGHLHRLAGDKDIQLLAVCDVDRIRRDQGRENADQIQSARAGGGEYKACTAYNDYRELLARDDIDAVVVVTPDHWHTPISLHAVQAGKDVYCEKPISITIGQGRQLVETVRRYGRIFQTGTQYRSIPTIREVCNFVREGGLGKVKQVFTLWTKLGGFFGAPRFENCRAAMDMERTQHSYAPLDFALPAQPVPEGLDWDLWVGPALWHPYNCAYHINPIPGVVPWSFEEDFGAASSTWFHSHSADVIQYALAMETSGPVELIHPADGQYPTLTCKYANGTLLHLVDHWGMVKDLYKAVPADARLEGNFGGVFVGERGWVTSMSTGGQIEGGPNSIFEEMKLTTRQVNIGDNNHHANFFDCIRTRRAPSCPEEIGHRSASLGHLTIIAYKLQRSLKWDPAKEEFLNADEANRQISRAMRAPWNT